MRRVSLRQEINMRAMGYARHPITAGQAFARELRDRDEQRERGSWEAMQRRECKPAIRIDTTGVAPRKRDKRAWITRAVDAVAGWFGYERKQRR